MVASAAGKSAALLITVISAMPHLEEPLEEIRARSILREESHDLVAIPALADKHNPLRAVAHQAEGLVTFLAEAVVGGVHFGSLDDLCYIIRIHVYPVLLMIPAARRSATFNSVRY